MSAGRASADEQLQRILYILPAASQEGGALISDLARELEVTPERIIADINEATARSFHHAGGTVDPFTIFLDGERVEVDVRNDFNRPTRLNNREAMALTLGLRVLAGEAEDGRREEILAFAARLEATLCAPDTLPADSAVAEDGVEYEAFHLALGDDGFRGTVADAVSQRCVCEIWYLKPGEGAPEKRRVAPYRLIHHAGAWYIAAADTEREGLRFFRMDRVMDARLLEESPAPPPPAEFEAWASGIPFVADEPVDVAIRYDARIARWIAERGECTRDEDGSVVVRHPVSDRRWVVRHVLQYAGAAVVEEPEPVREWVRAAAQGVVERLASPAAMPSTRP